MKSLHPPRTSPVKLVTELSGKDFARTSVWQLPLGDMIDSVILHPGYSQRLLPNNVLISNSFEADGVIVVVCLVVGFSDVFKVVMFSEKGE